MKRWSHPLNQQVKENGVVTYDFTALLNGKPLPVDSELGSFTVESFSEIDSVTGDVTYTYEAIEQRGSMAIVGTPNYVDLAITDSVTDPTRFAFEPVGSTEVAAGIPFMLGTLTFTNATWFIDPLGSALDFSIVASSTVAGLNDQEFNGTLRLFTNSNSADTPEERADWFYIEERPELGSVRVLELDDGTNVGSIELWGQFGSLDLVEFRNPTNGAFLNPSTTSDLAPVPEPATMLLLGTGLIGLAGFRRKFRKK